MPAGEYGAVSSGAANTVIKSSAGREAAVVVTTAGGGTGSVQLFDNPSTNSGNVVFALPAGNAAAVGNIYQLDIEFKTGLTVQNVLSGPAIVVYYD